jgi:hypothetical protein
MVTTAQINVNARNDELQQEYDDAIATKKKHTGCFKDVGEALKTIFSAGISCYMLDQTMKKAEKMAKEIKRTQNNFNNNVRPLVDKLAGLTGVAESLLKEAITTTAAVRRFEEQLNTSVDSFKSRQGSEIAIKLNASRDMIVEDLDELIKVCDQTMRATQKRENDFKSIIISVDKDINGLMLNMVNLAAN